MRADALPKFPKTLAQLIQRGGPEAFARGRARDAAQEERDFWLMWLEGMPEREIRDAGSSDAMMRELYIKALRRRLGKQRRVPIEVIRAQTRERVRRFRHRRAAAKPSQ
jgi:hypothetical protein